MERLTEREPYFEGEEYWTSAKEPDDEEIDKVYFKLKEYEDLEEQGLLLRLPCKIGDKVYTCCSWGIEEGIVGSIEIIADMIFVNNTHREMIGTSNNIFLTREEAEAKLAEMEKKNV